MNFKEVEKRATFQWALIELERMYIDDIKSGKLDINYILKKKEDVKPKREKKQIVLKSEVRKLIDSKLKISEIAKEFGYKVKANKMVCPFHNDTDPSLSFNDKLNVFYCFGCNATGDIVDLYRRLKCLKK